MWDKSLFLHFLGGVLEWHCLLLKREHIKKNLRNDEYDLVIIGGGITGAGIALDASERGMKVALVEMQDFAQGTSSRSNKISPWWFTLLKTIPNRSSCRNW